MTNIETVYLVADIGGTNIRIAQADIEQGLFALEQYKCCDYPSLQAVLGIYLERFKLSGKPIIACLAIACPTDDDLISMTNLPWSFSQALLKAELGFKQLFIVNDYTAIAMAIPLLGCEQVEQVGGRDRDITKPISVCGPGTGLGVATLINVGSAQSPFWHCINGEGGHIDFAAVDDNDIRVLQYLRKIKERVSYEQLLSGYGLEQIYRALADGKEAYKAELPAQCISELAIEEKCDLCVQALNLFCCVLGSFSGNLALLHNAQGGVFIAGGIVPRFINFLKKSEFRQRFEDKGRLSAIPKSVPVFIVKESQPGLLGAFAVIKQRLATIC